MEEKINVKTSLTHIGNALIAALNYRFYPENEIDKAIELIDIILSKEDYMVDCEINFASDDKNYILFYLSNIIYALKTKNEIVFSPDVLKWLGSVWKNFLKRNKSYQEYIKLFDKYKSDIKKYYPGDGNFVNQIENIHIVKNDFIDEAKGNFSKLAELEKFHKQTMEIVTTMKPSYFFLSDYYTEIKTSTGKTMKEFLVLKQKGIKGFGQENYTYENILTLSTQTVGILEAIYLSLKKKKLSKKIVSIDGKQKLLSISEIYNYYLDKFNKLKKEIASLKK